MSESSHVKNKTPLLGDKTYGFLKQSATIALPAVGALYFALAQIWGLPKAEEVVGSIAALNTFVGVLIGISTFSYNNSIVSYDGRIVLDGSDTPAIQLHPDSIESFNTKPMAILKIENEE